MSNKLTRLLLLYSQVIISLVIFIVFFLILFNQGQMISRSIPSIIQTLSNLLFSLILFFNYKRITTLDMRIAPILLLSTSLENIRILSYYSSVSYIEPVSQAILAQVFLFSMILSAVMFCGLSVAPFFKSYVTVNSYIIIGTLGCVLIMIFGPKVTNLEHLSSIQIYLVLIYILYSLALLSFLIELLSNLHTFNILKQIALTCIVAGDFLLTIYNKTTVNYFGLTLFLVGEFILSGMVFANSRGMMSDKSSTDMDANIAI